MGLITSPAPHKDFLWTNFFVQHMEFFFRHIFDPRATLNAVSLYRILKISDLISKTKAKPWYIRTLMRLYQGLIAAFTLMTGAIAFFAHEVVCAIASLTLLAPSMLAGFLEMIRFSILSFFREARDAYHFMAGVFQKVYKLAIRVLGPKRTASTPKTDSKPPEPPEQPKKQGEHAKIEEIEPKERKKSVKKAITSASAPGMSLVAKTVILSQKAQRETEFKRNYAELTALLDKFPEDANGTLVFQGLLNASYGALLDRVEIDSDYKNKRDASAKHERFDQLLSGDSGIKVKDFQAMAILYAACKARNSKEFQNACQSQSAQIAGKAPGKKLLQSFIANFNQLLESYPLEQQQEDQIKIENLRSDMDTIQPRYWQNHPTDKENYDRLYKKIQKILQLPLQIDFIAMHARALGVDLSAQKTAASQTKSSKPK